MTRVIHPLSVCTHTGIIWVILLKLVNTGNLQILIIFYNL